LDYPKIWALSLAIALLYLFTGLAYAPSEAYPVFYYQYYIFVICWIIFVFVTAGKREYKIWFTYPRGIVWRRPPFCIRRATKPTSLSDLDAEDDFDFLMAEFTNLFDEEEDVEGS
jgi:hypothetical protein